jgi:DNA-binding response OmpR family regulator
VSRRPRVLIVDDDPSTRLFTITTLQQAGYTIDLALNGQHALAEVMMSRPQCLLLDVFLSDGSGYAVCRRIRQSIPEHKMPIILTSASGTHLDRSYGLSQGAQRYLRKPFIAEILVQTVREVMPEPFRSAAPSSSLQGSYARLEEFIPHRVVNQDEMRASNPFSYTTLSNERVRQTYAAIDGKKTVRELSGAIGLQLKEITKVLHILTKENYIRIYDASGILVEGGDL